MISVILPTYKSPDMLDLCLRSAIEGQQNKNQIIVVVDGFYDLNKEILEKWSEHIDVLNLEQNVGLCRGTNLGVYNAKHNKILIVNDDNVFPKEWDVELEKELKMGRVITPNQIEPSPSMFKQFHIKNLGQDPTSFDLKLFWNYEESLPKKNIDRTGSTLPFAMSRLDYLAVGGWDVMYPSPHVVDWDFFAKCEYHGYEMIRVYKHFYHFASIATRNSPEEDRISRQKEQQAHLFFENKWGTRAEHNRETNSKALSIF